MGPHEKALLIRRIAHDAVPSGGGLQDGIEFLMSPQRMGQAMRDARAWVNHSVCAVQQAEDGADLDREQICELLLEKLKS